MKNHFQLKFFIVLFLLTVCLSACINKKSNSQTDVINNKYYYEYSQIYKSYNKVPIYTTINALKEYLKKFPKSFEGWTFLGIAYTTQHQYGKAEEAYKNALKQNPNYSIALTGLATLYDWDGRTDSARLLARLAFAKGDSTVNNIILQAGLDIRMGDTSLASKLIQNNIHNLDTLDNTNLIPLVCINKELNHQVNVTSILTVLQKRNVKDSLLDLYIDNKLSAVEFLKQKGQSISYGK